MAGDSLGIPEWYQSREKQGKEGSQGGVKIKKTLV
jgi:hypothetical protein